MADRERIEVLERALSDALLAMRAWGAEEDGIPGGHVGAWEAYQNGAALLGWCILPELSAEYQSTDHQEEPHTPTEPVEEPRMTVECSRCHGKGGYHNGLRLAPCPVCAGVGRIDPFHGTGVSEGRSGS